MTEKVEIGNATLYCGDCIEILPEFEHIDCILTDPPYGGGLSMDYAKRFKSQAGNWWKNSDRSYQSRHEDIIGDDKPFDPSHLLALNAPINIMWGANWYASRLPDRGGWWAWDKRRGIEDAEWPMSEIELAWTNIGKGARIFRYMWFGLLRDGERGEHYHPTQKPIALMEWCLQKAKLPGIVCDPYMGSGPTGVAAIRLGRKFVGIEIDRTYFDIACERIDKEASQGKLF